MVGNKSTLHYLLKKADSINVKYLNHRRKTIFKNSESIKKRKGKNTKKSKKGSKSIKGNKNMTKSNKKSKKSRTKTKNMKKLN
jgi:hypothetical protein